MNKGKRVLLVLRDLRIGSGVVSCIMNYYDGLINNGYKIDFLLLSNVKSPYYEKVKKNNGQIYILPSSKLKYNIKAKLFLDNFFKDVKYEIIHVNIIGPYGSWILKKAQKIKTRIFHCHAPRDNTNIKRKISTYIFTNLCVKRANKYMACSYDAGNSVFKNKKFAILKNCIDSQKYKYSEKSRKSIRKSLGISEEKFLIGSVGRLEPEKNPIFALDCIAEILKEKECEFIWVGNGSLMSDIKKYVTQKKIETKVNFVGVKDNVQEWYSAFDCLLMPSEFEGFGIALIEAQASGLPCFTSSGVPQDTKISDNIYYYKISDGPKNWCKNILKEYKKVDRANYYKNIIEYGFDRKKEIDALSKYYDEYTE